MNILQRIGQAISGKSSEANKSLVAMYRLGDPAWTPANYADLTKRGYLENPYIFAAVGLIARSCAGIDWGLFQVRGSKLNEVDTHPLLDLWNKPSPGMGRSQFIEQMIGYLELAGNAYIERVGPKNGPPKELYALRPDMMKVRVGTPENPIAGYSFGNLQKTEFDSEFILHLKFFHPLNEIYGLSPLEAAAKSMDQNNWSRAWNVALLQNSGRPSGAFIAEHLSDPDYEKLKNERDTFFSGTRNAGRIPILTGGLDWKEMGLSPKDMDWLAGSQKSAEELAMALNIPSEFVGGKKTYNTYQEARKALYEENILPLMDWIRDEFNGWLVPLFGDNLRLEYDKDDIEALAEDREKMWARINAAEFLKVNEKRVALGYEEVDGGNVILVPFNLMPLSMSGESQPTTAPIKMAIKCIGNREEKDRRRLWEIVARKRGVWEQAVAKQASKIFRLEKADVIATLKNDGKLEDAIDRGRWAKFIKATYINVAEDFANAARDGFKEIHPTYTKADTWLKWVLEYIAKYTGMKIKFITDTTMEAVKDIVAKAERSGMAIAETASLLDEFFDSPARSMLIARTEIQAASGLGTNSFARDAGMDTHSWICASDELSREWHIEANGQTIPLDQPFQVNGEELMFPGDSSLGATGGNICNCRCVEDYGRPIGKE
jgi:HK97 family phage portal protein